MDLLGSRDEEEDSQRPNKARGRTKETRKREGSDLRTNLFQEGEDGTIMKAVHQGFHIHLDSFSDQPIEMMFKLFGMATNVFVLERASREYLTCPDRRTRSAECSNRTGDRMKAWRSQ